MPEFIHLHNHTHYSLLDGACRIDDLIQKAVKYNMSSLAITDHGNMFGAIEFYKKANKAGIKPIIGCEVYMAPESRTERGGIIKKAYYHFLLLAKDLTGYRNLMKLVTIGYLEGFYYRPRIDKQILRKYSNGIIGSSACLQGEIPQKLLANDKEGAKRIALEYLEIFRGDFFLEVHDHGLKEELFVKEKIIQIGKELNIPVIATNDIHYMEKDHYNAHDTLICLQTGKEKDDPKRLKYATDEIYFKSPDEMAEKFKDFPNTIENTVRLSEMCESIEIDMSHFHSPMFPLPENESTTTLDDYMVKLAYQGAFSHYDNNLTDDIKKRLDYELKVIKQLGYAGYFLIVKDFIDYARRRNIPVGLGRGSAAGSLVSYCLGITDIDPLKYHLLFERFLNPDRITMPDIDIDFCYERREEIIDYVKSKYGEKNVAQIITFGSMASRGVLKDVGRVLKIDYGEIDNLSKQIPIIFGKPLPLKRAFEEIPELKEIKKKAEKDKKYHELVEYSFILEGIARHASTHAAGVVIAPKEITEFSPLFKHPQTGDITTQYDMRALEDIGLLKMDFLGLRTLTVIEKTVKLLKENLIEIDLRKIPMDDPSTYELFSLGRTVAIFQFESAGMQEYLKKLKPSRFEDLIAMNALYRPGPMEMIDDFIDRKYGRKEIKVLHPKLEPILKESYGIIVYQEQVMQIASEVAGMTLAQADIMRRAMGKKKKDVMNKQREVFIQGAVQNGIPRKTAMEIFDLIYKFASYGFNKSHSAAYSMIAYQTAYLKAHYPVIFMAATLSSEMGNTDRVVKLIDECRQMDIEIFPPDINKSDYGFVLENEKIRFGLGAVKNIGTGAIQSIIHAREKLGKFTNFFQFCENLELRLVNKKVLESLVLCGAMDSLEGHRAQLYKAIPHAIALAQTVQEEIRKGQTNLFESGKDTSEILEVAHDYPALLDAEPWSSRQAMKNEKELVGFYISGHPLSEYEDEIRTFSILDNNRLKAMKGTDDVRLCGMFTAVRTLFDRKNDRMAFVKLENFNETFEILIFSDAYKKYKELIEVDAMVMVIGKKSMRDVESPKVIANEIIPLADVRERYTRSVHLILDRQNVNETQLNEVQNILQENKGSCSVIFNIPMQNEKRLKIKSQKYAVKPTQQTIANLRQLFGRENVFLGE